MVKKRERDGRWEIVRSIIKIFLFFTTNQPTQQTNSPTNQLTNTYFISHKEQYQKYLWKINMKWQADNNKWKDKSSFQTT